MSSSNETERRPLYSAALKADDDLDSTISKHYPGKTRWTLSTAQAAHPAIVASREAKVSADGAWLAFLRSGNK